MVHLCDVKSSLDLTKIYVMASQDGQITKFGAIIYNIKDKWPSHLRR